MKNKNTIFNHNAEENAPSQARTTSAKPTLRVIALALLLFLAVATVTFIWSNSFDSVDISLDKSGQVTDFITPFLEIFLGRGNVTEHIVRKLAHFCEFTVLGIEVCSFALLVLRRRTAYVSSALFCLAVAAVDESIQIFTGRGPSVVDVLIDFTGAVFGLAVLTAVLCIARMIIKRRTARRAEENAG